MTDVNCPAGRDTAIAMCKRMISELEAGAFDAVFTSEEGREAFVTSEVNCAIGDLLGCRGIQVVIVTAPFGEVFRG